ncbi:MAG: MFS transporter [bacterium]
MNRKKKIIVSLKSCLGFGVAITAYILDVFGYVPNIDQSADALTRIRMTMSIILAATFAICAVVLLFYSIDKKLEIQFTDELAERRKAFRQ